MATAKHNNTNNNNKNNNNLLLTLDVYQPNINHFIFIDSQAPYPHTTQVDKTIELTRSVFSYKLASRTKYLRGLCQPAT